MRLTNLIEQETGKTSQVAFAEKVGVRQSTVSAWVNGVSLPPSTRLPSLAAALGMPLADLSALVARERSARLRRRRRAGGGVVGHGASSCRKPGSKAAQRPGQKAAAVSGAPGKREGAL